MTHGPAMIHGDQIADGMISAAKMVTGTITAASAIIADAAISTLKLAGNAVSSTSIQTLTNTLTNGTFNSASTVSVSVDLPIGTTITAIAQFGASIGFSGNLTNSWALVVDGTTVHSASGEAVDYTMALVGSKIITTTAQPHIVEAHVDIVMSSTAETTNRTLSLQILKR